MSTWLDLRDSVRRTGRIDGGLVTTIAANRTSAELAELHKLGIPRTFDAEYVYQRTLTEQVAQTALDALATARMLADASPAERAARQHELLAELCEGSIPPRPRDAADHREIARICRAASWRQQAAE